MLLQRLLVQKVLKHFQQSYFSSLFLEKAQNSQISNFQAQQIITFLLSIGFEHFNSLGIILIDNLIQKVIAKRKLFKKLQRLNGFTL